jgi:Ca-activated chloride channel homolog
MKTITDHPQLTAYVLNELSPQERATFESELQSNAELRAAVEELRRTTEVIGQALSLEPAFELTPAQRRALQQPEIVAPLQQWWHGFLEATREGQRRWMWGGLGTATAVLTVALFTFSGEMKEREEAVISGSRGDSHKIVGYHGAAPILEKQSKQEKEATDVPLGRGISVEATKPKVKGDENPKEQTEIIVATPRPVAAPMPAALNEEIATDLIKDKGIYVETAKPGVVLSGNVDGNYSYDKLSTAAPDSFTLAPPAAPPSEATAQSFDTRDKAAREFSQTWTGGVTGVAGSESLAKQTAEQPIPNNENYAPRTDSNFLNVVTSPLSTFSIDVDTAAYANVRRFLNQGQLPPKDAVRIEELLNYFPYQDPTPKGSEPFAVKIEAMAAPWEPEHQLIRIGLKGREIVAAQRPAMNLVFLIDVSGSMDEPNKLPLVQDSLRLLVRQLREQDRLSIAVYAGNSGLVLPATSGDQKEKILAAIDRLQAGGSTNGAAGIQLAYQVAVEQFIKKGVNRVLLATDGDFNVGVSSDGDLVRLIEEKAKSGVFLSVLGFGMGNLKDSKMEQLADKGNGNYAYIDTREEARKVLVEQASGTLVTIAKDVKIQVEFNPAQVASYRLIGYENRALADRDFNDDKKDAGEIGAGHSVTALYEVVPIGQKLKGAGVDALKYQVQSFFQPKESPELCTVKLRFKTPTGTKSELREVPYVLRQSEPSSEIKFAAAVAGFGMLLRDSEHKGAATWDAVLKLAREGLGQDPEGYRAEFLTLVQKAKQVSTQR